MTLPLSYINTDSSGDTLVQGLNKVNLAIQYLNSGELSNASNLTQGTIPTERISMVDFSKISGIAIAPLGINCHSATQQLHLISSSTTAGHRIQCLLSNHLSNPTVTASFGLALNTTSFSPQSLACGMGDLFIITQSRSNNNTSSIRFCTPIDNEGRYADRMTISKTGAITISSESKLFFDPAFRQMINLTSDLYGIGIQPNTLSFRTAATVSWYQQGAFSSVANDPGPSGVELMRLCQGDNIQGAGLHLNPRMAGNNDAWFRSYASSGWMNQTYQGGWYMSDPMFLRSYNDKSVLFSRAWDSIYGNVHLTGSAPALTLWNTTGNHKWLLQSTGSNLAIYKTLTGQSTALDWIQKFAVGQNGDLYWGLTGNWLSSYLNQTLLTSSAPSFSKAYIGSGSDSDFNINSSTSCLQIVSADTSDCANIAFYRPGIFAAKFGINANNQFEWGGWSMGPARMLLDASGNLTILGNLTANNITLTGGSMSPVKSIRQGNITGYSNVYASKKITISPAINKDKSVLIQNNQQNNVGYPIWARIHSDTELEYFAYGIGTNLVWNYQILEFV